MSPDDSNDPAQAGACGHASTAGERGEGAALRCDCGSLLARYVGGRIEIKCRRCKRTVPISIDAADAKIG